MAIIRLKLTGKEGRRWLPSYQIRETRRPPTLPPGLHVRTSASVAGVLREDIHTAARWLRRRMHFPHAVEVYVVDRPTVARGEHVGWGLYLTPEEEPDDPAARSRIFVAGGTPRVLSRHYGADRAACLNDVVDTLLHECVHYEQWRDRRPVNERGVQSRVDALLRRYRNEYPVLA